ncbi:hypothetical protein [Aeromonas veronii]|uniref:hypothetical protein n=1 Tax=Aeromonas TaxID=642 RepID=UPI002443D5C7|nr:hypothetical protein [Aeromonas veronii]
MKSEYMSLAILLVSICTLLVSFSQMRIASAKTRLDLYNKRFSIYLVALDYYQSLWQEFSEDSVKDINLKYAAFVKAYREAQFLFDTDSGIYEVLGEMQDHGSSMSCYIKRRVECDAKNVEDRSDLLTLLDSYNTSYPLFNMKLKVLEIKMKKYLDFSNVDGWKVV